MQASLLVTLEVDVVDVCELETRFERLLARRVALDVLLVHFSRSRIIAGIPRFGPTLQSLFVVFPAAAIKQDSAERRCKKKKNRPR
jgi:hypothetical protein